MQYKEKVVVSATLNLEPDEIPTLYNILTGFMVFERDGRGPTKSKEYILAEAISLFMKEGKAL